MPSVIEGDILAITSALEEYDKTFDQVDEMTKLPKSILSPQLETMMNLRFLHLVIIGLVVIVLSTACASSSTPSPADQQATNIAMGVAFVRT